MGHCVLFCSLVSRRPSVQGPGWIDWRKDGKEIGRKEEEGWEEDEGRDGKMIWRKGERKNGEGVGGGMKGAMGGTRRRTREGWEEDGKKAWRKREERWEESERTWGGRLRGGAREGM